MTTNKPICPKWGRPPCQQDNPCSGICAETWEPLSPRKDIIDGIVGGAAVIAAILLVALLFV